MNFYPAFVPGAPAGWRDIRVGEVVPRDARYWCSVRRAWRCVWTYGWVREPHHSSVMIVPDMTRKPNLAIAPLTPEQVLEHQRLREQEERILLIQAWEQATNNLIERNAATLEDLERWIASKR